MAENETALARRGFILVTEFIGKIHVFLKLKFSGSSRRFA
jgi:hypothetical protein